MSTDFSRTTHTLSLGGFRYSMWGLLAIIALLSVWTAWSLFGSLPVYAVTNSARLEVDRAVHPVEAPIDGRVVATHLNLGEEVQARDVLVELETDTQQLELDEERARSNAVAQQLVSLREEAAAAKRALIEAQQAGRAALDEARAKFREARIIARLAQEEAVKSERLHARGFLSEIELKRDQAEAQQRQAATDSLRSAIDRLKREQQEQEHDRHAGIVKLTREISRLQGQQETAAATIARLTHEVRRRHIRAPVSGLLGEVSNLHIGAFVSEGDKIATVVPASALKVVADFPPAAVLGRINPGQPARLRLAGFPWAQYGTLEAAVATVATEATNGRVRVELALSSDQSSLIPLQHGLPGIVEVEVERVPPATLVLRAAGQLLAASQVAPSSEIVIRKHPND